MTDEAYKNRYMQKGEEDYLTLHQAVTVAGACIMQHKLQRLSGLPQDGAAE